MSTTENQSANISESMDLDTLENELDNLLGEKLAELEILKKNHKNIGTPESLGETIENAVWEQFKIQIGANAGEDFIEKNRGLTLNLSDDAHIQTTENFSKGKIATHNDKIDYQERYDKWNDNFVKDENGNVVTKYDNRSDTYKEVLKKEARADFDKGRPKGGGSIDMDHTISAGEIIRDPQANAHLSRDEQIKFANSDKNLNPLDQAANKSKSDSTMDEWLNSERDGQKPADRFNIDEKKLKKKNKEARKEYEKLIREGEKKSIEAGRQSQKEEAMRMGGEALQAALLGLLASFLRAVIKKVILWIKDGQKNISELLKYIKSALTEFFSNIKEHLKVALETAIMSVVTAVLRPIARTFRKLWSMIKESVKSIYEAIKYITNPDNKDKPIGQLIFEASKIVVAGLSGVGALVLGDLIEKALMTFPVFAFEIPLFGSLASILGIFLGALVAGVVGAIVIHLLNKLTLKYQERNSAEEIHKIKNEILNLQPKAIEAKLAKRVEGKAVIGEKISIRHQEAANIASTSVGTIMNNSAEVKKSVENFDRMNKILDNL